MHFFHDLKGVCVSIYSGEVRRHEYSFPVSKTVLQSTPSLQTQFFKVVLIKMPTSVFHELVQLLKKVLSFFRKRLYFLLFKAMHARKLSPF